MTKKELIGNYVYGRIQSLVSIKDSGPGRGELARLRHGVGKTPGEDPVLWGAFLNNAPDGLYPEESKNGVAKEEWAVYITLTLFALHQQGNANSVHANGVSLGSAANRLMDKDSADDREHVLRRFAPIITASDMNELSHHLRCFIQLIKAKGIALDYVKLSKDIYDFQFEESRKNVQLNWGRDFYKNNNSNEGERI